HTSPGVVGEGGEGEEQGARTRCRRRLAHLDALLEGIGQLGREGPLAGLGGIVVELDLALDLRAGVDDLEAAEGDAADAEAIGTRRHALCLYPEVPGAVAIAAEAGLGRSD